MTVTGGIGGGVVGKVIAPLYPMLRQQQAALLRAARACLPGLSQAPGLIAAACRAQSSQAAPVESALGPALPPFDYVPPPYTGPSKAEVLALRKKYLNPGAADA